MDDKMKLCAILDMLGFDSDIILDYSDIKCHVWLTKMSIEVMQLIDMEI